MNNMVKAVLIICATVLIIFVLYFKFFSPLAQCEKAMAERFKSETSAKYTVRCLDLIN